MRRCAASLILFVLILSTLVCRAEEGKVCKVLPQFLDLKGRQSLAPSLYERDAYQFYLRKHPGQRSTLRIAVQWKAKGVDWDKIKLRAELRGLLTNSVQTITLEEPVRKNGIFSTWSNFDITGEKYKTFGELVAWRVSLWEGDRELGDLKSFLWSGVAAH